MNKIGNTRFISLVIAITFMLTCFTFANTNNGDKKVNAASIVNDPIVNSLAVKFKVGMVTDSGNIDDESFNQATWEGVKRAADKLDIQAKYLKASGPTEADYLAKIANLYASGYRLIVCPGFMFETAIGKAQKKYPSAKFVTLDAQPKVGDVYKTGSNTASIFFAEHQAGFIAGVAAAVKLKTGKVGFIGGMAIPPVQKFNWGFQRGIKYANDKYKTKITMSKADFVYQGTFSDVTAGGKLASQMFNRGVKAIFCAAGAVGIGAINEAKTRAIKGKSAWIVGVDSDQYSQGLYSTDKSVILTSAMKRLDIAAYNMVIANSNGKFPGGKVSTYTASNNGVGIPPVNPNLSADAIAKAKDVVAKIKSKTLVVSAKDPKYF